MPVLSYVNLPYLISHFSGSYNNQSRKKIKHQDGKDNQGNDKSMNKRYDWPILSYHKN